MSYKGVKRLKSGKFAASFCEGGRQQYIGLFDDEIVAAKAVDEARMAVGGDYYRLNFPESYVAPTERKCENCEQVKSLDQFRHVVLSSGIRKPEKICNDCRVMKSRQRIQLFVEQRGMRPTMAYATKGIRERVSFMLSKIRYRCTGKKEFTITVDDVIRKLEQQEYLCALTGRRLMFDVGQGRQAEALSVDRIDSSKGYTPDNIQIVTAFANRAKQDASMTEFIEFCRDVVDSFKKVGVVV